MHLPALGAALAIGAELAVQLQQQLAGRPVGAMNDEAPADAVGLGADLIAMPRDARLIVVAPGFGAAGGGYADAAKSGRETPEPAATVAPAVRRKN